MFGLRINYANFEVLLKMETFIQMGEKVGLEGEIRAKEKREEKEERLRREQEEKEERRRQLKEE